MGFSYIIKNYKMIFLAQARKDSTVDQTSDLYREENVKSKKSSTTRYRNTKN